jgi:DNA-binding Lrp family transcriptional regulator
MAPDEGTDGANALEGKTLKVYRYLFKAGSPQGIRDIQRGLNLSSPSVAEYHVRKLLNAGLIEDYGSGYVVNKNVLGNMIRIRRRLIPYQVAYIVFFATALFILVVFFRNNAFDAFWFGLSVVAVALGLSVWETVRSFQKGP